MLSVPIENVFPLWLFWVLNRSTSIVVVPPTTTLLPATIGFVLPVAPLARSCSVPPFRLSWLLPNAWRTSVALAPVNVFCPIRVPADRVVPLPDPVYAVFAPLRIKVLPALFSVTPVTLLPIAPLIVTVLLPAPELVMVPVLLTAPVPSVIPPVLLALRMMLPVLVSVPVTVNSVVDVLASVRLIAPEIVPLDDELLLRVKPTGVPLLLLVMVPPFVITLLPKD